MLKFFAKKRARFNNADYFSLLTESEPEVILALDAFKPTKTALTKSLVTGDANVKQRWWKWPNKVQTRSLVTLSSGPKTVTLTKQPSVIKPLVVPSPYNDVYETSLKLLFAKPTCHQAVRQLYPLTSKVYAKDYLQKTSYYLQTQRVINPKKRHYYQHKALFLAPFNLTIDDCELTLLCALDHRSQQCLQTAIATGQLFKSNKVKSTWLTDHHQLLVEKLAQMLHSPLQALIEWFSPMVAPTHQSNFLVALEVFKLNTVSHLLLVELEPFWRQLLVDLLGFFLNQRVCLLHNWIDTIDEGWRIAILSYWRRYQQLLPLALVVNSHQLELWNNYFDQVAAFHYEQLIYYGSSLEFRRQFKAVADFYNHYGFDYAIKK